MQSRNSSDYQLSELSKIVLKQEEKGSFLELVHLHLVNSSPHTFVKFIFTLYTVSYPYLLFNFLVLFRMGPSKLFLSFFSSEYEKA